MNCFPILPFLIGIILFVFFLLKPHETINNLDTEDSKIPHFLKEQIFTQISKYPSKTHMAIALIEGDSCRFYGAIKQGKTVEEIDNKNSLFEIGSITKVFTMALLANMVLDSTISLNKNINDDLSFPIHKQTKITYESLANHTSGLPRRPTDIVLSAIKSPLNPYKYYNTKKLEGFLSERLDLITEAGREYQYSNLGMGILGYMLCEVSGKSYETLLSEQIFSKYGLTSTTALKDNVKSELVPALGPLGNKTANWELASLEAAGNIVSSTQDLSKFVIAHFNTNNTELALTRQSTFVVNDGKEIGLGLHILKDKSENNWYFHNGGTGGYRCALVFDNVTQKGIIVLTNISIGHRKSDQIDEFCIILMEEL